MKMEYKAKYKYFASITIRLFCRRSTKNHDLNREKK